MSLVIPIIRMYCLFWHCESFSLGHLKNSYYRRKKFLLISLVQM